MLDLLDDLLSPELLAKKKAREEKAAIRQKKVAKSVTKPWRKVHSEWQFVGIEVKLQLQKCTCCQTEMHMPLSRPLFTYHRTVTYCPPFGVPQQRVLETHRTYMPRADVPHGKQYQTIKTETFIEVQVCAHCVGETSDIRALFDLTVPPEAPDSMRTAFGMTDSHTAVLSEETLDVELKHNEEYKAFLKEFEKTTSEVADVPIADLRDMIGPVDSEEPALFDDYSEDSEA